EAAPRPVAEQTLAGSVRQGAPVDLASLPGDEIVVAARAAEVPEDALFATEEAPWRFAAVGEGDEVLVGDVSAPDALAPALGERRVVAHDAKALGEVPARLAHDT